MDAQKMFKCNYETLGDLLQDLNENFNKNNIIEIFEGIG